MLRRALALGGALLVLILLVLGVKGCLDARANRALSDYARNVAQILEETQQTSKSFFDRLSDPGSLSVSEFVNEVNADRSAMDNYASRIDGLSTPGDMSSAQRNLELVYALRSGAMTEIANKVRTALGDAGARKATASIERQVRRLAASDVVYETVVRPEIESVLADKGVSAEVVKSSFVPGGTEWLEEGAVGEALAEVSGSTGGKASPGVHGLGLVGASLNGSELAEGVPAVASKVETAEVEVQVENQGESTESGITVSVSFGGKTLKENINSIAAGETESVTIPLTPTPSGEVTLEVKVDPVPGEQVTENNEASYTVVFE